MERKKIRKNSHTSKKSKASLDTNPDSNNEKDKENKKEIKDLMDQVTFNAKKLKDFKVPNKFLYKIRIANVLGGFTKVKQIKAVKRYKPEIIVATPGRLWELIESNEIELDFQMLRFLILDEADRLMEKHHFSELKKIINKVYSEKEKELVVEDNDDNAINQLKKKLKSIGKYTNINDLNLNKEKVKKSSTANRFLTETEENVEESSQVDEEELNQNEEDLEELDEVEDQIEKEDDEEAESNNDNDYNEDEFVKKLLKEKGIEDAEVEDVDMADMFDNIKDNILDDSGLVKSSSKKRRNKKAGVVVPSRQQLKDNKKNIENFTNSKSLINSDKNKGNSNKEYKESKRINTNNKSKKDNQFENEEEYNEEYENEEIENNEEEIEDAEEEIEEENEEDEKNKIKNAKKEEKIKKYNESKENFNNSITVPGKFVALRTMLCSATIEVKTKEKVKVPKSKNYKNFKSRNKEEDVPREKELLDNLIKTLKFYNKLVYIKLDPQIKMTEENIPDLSSSYFLPAKLELQAFKCEADKKDYYLYHLLYLNRNKSVIVFTNSISQTKKLYSLFSYFDFNIKCLHSQMQQKQRISKLDKFRKNAEKAKFNGNVLLCTDVGSRGLDIPEVDVVINYHIPLTSENFVHRSGRTARANKEGQCLNLVSEKEGNLYKKILRELKIYELTMKTMPISQLDQYKSMFDYARKLEKEVYHSNKTQREKEWIRKQAEKCDLIPDDNLIEELELRERNPSQGNKINPHNNRNDEDCGNSRLLNKKRKKLNLNHLEKKKIQQNVLSHDISRTSYINPNSVAQLNKLLYSSDKMNNINLTETLRSAYSDIQGAKKSKQKRTRHVKRRQRK